MTVEEAIKTAIEYEIRIRDIYREAVAAVDDEVGKRIFETLGQDEQHHIDYLEHKLEQFQKTGAIQHESWNPPFRTRKALSRKLTKSNHWRQRIFWASNSKC